MCLYILSVQMWIVFIVDTQTLIKNTENNIMYVQCKNYH